MGSGLGHSLHALLHEPLGDCSRVESDAGAYPKRRYAAPLRAPENRYAGHPKEIRKLFSGQSTMNGLDARGEGHQAMRIWAVEYAVHCTPPKISLTFSRTCWLRDGFR